MEQRRYSVLKAGKMENCKDFREFDKRPNWRRLGQSIPSTAAFVGCSCGALVSIYQNWFKEAAVVNQQQADGRPRLSDAQTSYCSSNLALMTGVRIHSAYRPELATEEDLDEQLSET